MESKSNEDTSKVNGDSMDGTDSADVVKHSPQKRFKCLVPACKAAYSKQCKLDVHWRSHTGERPFVCDRNGCSKSYTNAAHLKRHKSVVHESLLEVICQVPGCGLVLSNKQNLKKHHLRVHDPTVTYDCAKCSLKFKKKYLLKRHLLEHSDSQPLKCQTCEIIFSQPYLYNKHMRGHKTYSCDCGATFDRWSKFCEHRKTTCKVPRIDHKCAICDKVFTTSSNLKAHTIIHLKDSQKVIYRCAYLNCTRSYQYKKNLDQHVRSFHEKDIEHKEFPCTHSDCNQILSSKKNLKQHIRNMHSNLPKINKPRAKRKDKGKPKKNMVFLLSGLGSIAKREENSVDGSIEKLSTCSNSIGSINDSDSAIITSENNCGHIENSNKTPSINNSDSEGFAMDFSSIRSSLSNKDPDPDITEKNSGENFSLLNPEQVNDPCVVIEHTQIQESQA